MQNPTACLTEAMFVASESYSGSTYEMNLFQAMDKACDEIFVVVHGDDLAHAVSARATA